MANTTSMPAQGQIWEGDEVIGEVPEASTAEPVVTSALRFKEIDRQQMTWAAIDVEQLIAPDHLARAIWALTGELDWSRFCAHVKAVEGRAGCSPYSPRLLASVWILAYSEGVGSSRAVEEMCKYHPAYRWLTGMQEIGYHTLSDFRVEHKEELDEMFAQVLAVLQKEGMIKLERITQDGTKIQAAASPRSMHREPTLQKHLESARQQVRQMREQEPAEAGELSLRRHRAQERAAREKLERMEQSLKELQKVRVEEAKAQERRAHDKKKEPTESRVSETEPEVRKMKRAADGGYVPAYNLQIMTDAAEGIVVGVKLVPAQNDQQQLEEGLKEVERQTGVIPRQAVVDEGYLSRATVLEMERRGVDLFAGGQLEGGKNTALNEQNWKNKGVTPDFYSQKFVYDPERDLYLCPAGQQLPHQQVNHDREGVERHRYKAPARQCRACLHQPHCCPVSEGKRVKGRMIVRTQNVPIVAAFVEKMKTPEAQAIYQQRKRIAEFPNLWIKEKLGLRRFRVRGLAKASCEAMWACLTYNIQQWWRSRWKQNPAASVATA